MPNRVILHLGVHKTGTSSIQAMLANKKNRQHLSDQGFFFPQTIGNNHSEFFQSAFTTAPEKYHSNLARRETRKQVMERAERQKCALVGELGSLSNQTIIFSGEDGCILDAEALIRLRRFIYSAVQGLSNADVVLYTRHPVSYVESAVQENVKGNALTLEFAKKWHIKETKDKYKRMIDNISKGFGANSIYVRSFEEACSITGDVVKDFAGALGICLEGMKIWRDNIAICDEVVRILSEFNHREIDLTQREREVLFRLPGQRFTLLAEEEINETWDLADGDVSMLERDYGIRYKQSVKYSVDARSDFSESFLREFQAVVPSFRPEIVGLVGEVMRRSGVHVT